MTEPAPFVLTPRAKPLRILSTSDWHLGNARVPAINVCNRLRDVLFPELPNIDLLNIGGDLWDTSLMLSSETNIIEGFLIDLLHECDRYRTVVRILRGTYLHDRDQSAALADVYHVKCRFTNDLKYINTMSLEEIQSLNVRILYLPDDLPYDTSDECLKVIQELLASRGWTWVDYVFGHGYFEHMLPSFIPKQPKCTYRIAQFKPLVRRYVCMGHVHLSDFTENVFYNNSFDRIAHGEEAPKGFVIVEDFGDQARLRIVENKAATKFMTIDLTGHTDKDTIGEYYLDQIARKFPHNEPGYVRVIHPSVEVRQALKRITVLQHPELSFSYLKTADEPSQYDLVSVRKSFDIAEYPTPTEDTLPQMILDFLEKNGGTQLTLARITELSKQK